MECWDGGEVRLGLAGESGKMPLPSSSGMPSGAILVRGNISGEITIQELLADNQRVPGAQGAYVRLQPAQGIRGIRFADLSQLTINHQGTEFLLTLETVTALAGQVLSRRYRIYSGTPNRIPPPVFRRPGPKGEVTVERIIGHTHPFPIPFYPNWNHPSWGDILYLQRIRGEWKRIYGPLSEPFGKIFGLPGDPVITYGPRSTEGNAVYP
jgi:hypothetical protein